MAIDHKTTVRLSAFQRTQLAKLAKKLQISESNVIRIAITRLAEAESVTKQANGD